MWDISGRGEVVKEEGGRGRGAHRVDNKRKIDGAGEGKYTRRDLVGG
jgi:hypothetical protein